MIFFLVYLLSHNVSRKIRQSLILLCEAHFALLYILKINLISNALERKGSISMGVLSQLGMKLSYLVYFKFLSRCCYGKFYESWFILHLHVNLMPNTLQGKKKVTFDDFILCELMQAYLKMKFPGIS